MKAQIVLTPTESKKLIAKGVVQMKEVQESLREGLVVMHPSTSTYFIFEELTGEKPQTEVWLSGTIVPKGLCVEWGSYSQMKKGYLATPGLFPYSWILKGKEPQASKTIDELCGELGEKDVYIKGVNALDAQGSAGVLIGSLAEGTIGRIIAAVKRRNFKMILPVGLEKLIPGSIKKAAQETGSNKHIEYSMGIPCSLTPVPGITVTEVDALRILTGVEALPISAGGLAGAEGAVVLLLQGEKEAVRQAVRLAEGVKGAKMREVKNPSCPECIVSHCPFAGTRKDWF